MIISYNIHSQSQLNLRKKFPTREVFIESLIQLESQIRPNDMTLAIYNTFVSFINSKKIRPTYTFIAGLLGIHRQTVYEAVVWLRKNGWLWTIRERDPLDPKKYLPLTYVLPFYLYDEYVRTQLSHILKSCSYFLLWTLSVSLNAAGLPIRESTDVFSLIYIREETKIRTLPKKRNRVNDNYWYSTTFAPFYQKWLVGSSNARPLKKEVSMSERRIIAKVLAIIPEISDSQLLVLDQYGDSQIEAALKRLEKKSPDMPAAYLLAVLKGIHQDDVKKGKGKVKVVTNSATQASLNDRYTAAEIEHCEKILELFDTISLEDPVEAQKILNRQVSSRWSMRWGTPDSFERRLQKLRGEK